MNNPKGIGILENRLRKPIPFGLLLLYGKKPYQ